MNATLSCDDAMFAVPSLQGIKAVSNGTHRAGNCASLGRCYVHAPIRIISYL